MPEGNYESGYIINSIKELLEREVLFSRACEKDSKKDGICITEK